MTDAGNKSFLTWLEQQKGKTHLNYIDGKWQESRKKQTFSLFHPAQWEEVLGYFQDSSKEDVADAVAAAKQAFLSWSNTPGPDRGAILYRFAELLEENAEELAFMLAAEQGKVLAEAKGEVGRAVKEVRFNAGEAFRVEGKTYPSERANVFTSTIQKPIGVIAAIAPWNFPVVTPIRKIAPALAYGCTVVYKPASETPWTSIRIMQLLERAGLPKGVVNLVTGGGRRVGNALAEHPDVRGISFTGSTKIGTAVNEIAASKLARTQLELGGKNPAIVLDYDDPALVAKEIVQAAFACSGQRCTSISRVIVTKDKAAEIIDSLKSYLDQVKVGAAWQEGATMGPVVSKSHLQTIQEYIQIGKEEGAEAYMGGELLLDVDLSSSLQKNSSEQNIGPYMLPVLFTNVTKQMRIATEEIFGPVLSVITVEDEEEALEVANATAYGLAASIFTKNLSFAYRLAEQLESGMIHINHGTASAAHVPFGGTKQSGFGAFSIGSSNKEFYTETKAIYIQY